MGNKLRILIILICFTFTSILCSSCSSGINDSNKPEDVNNNETASSNTIKEKNIVGNSKIEEVASPTNAVEINVMPVISVGSNEIIGGIVNGQWVDEKGISSFLKNIEYSVYNFDEQIGTGSAKLLNDNLINQKLSDGIDPDGVFWGLVDKYNPVPRKAYKHKGNIDIYKRLVKEYMDEEGLLEVSPDSINVFRVDLEGDGIEEAIVINSERSDNEAFSIVILRKLIGNTVKNIVLSKESAKYIKEEYAYGEPLIADPYIVSAILDLNGDGKMEIILEGHGFESILIKVFEIKGNDAVNVIDYSTRRFWYKDSYMNESENN